jgi:phosphoenolpyruvate phosphomutase
LPDSRRGKLKKQLDEKGHVRCIEVHNGLSALVCSEATNYAIEGSSPNFDALWVSSLTGSASRGLPDMEMYVLERRLELIDEVCQASMKPIIVDGDTGGETTSFEYLCTRLESLGVSAVVIEDKQHPKRNSLSLDSRHVLEEPNAFGAKIRRARSALLSDTFMIFARLESLIAGRTVDDALERAEIYLRNGAHGVMIHSKSKDGDDIIEFITRFRSAGHKEPIICVPTTYNKIRAQDLFEHGANIVIHANHMLRASHFAMKKVCKRILENDRSFEADGICSSVGDIFSLVGYDAALAREKQSTDA